MPTADATLLPPPFASLATEDEPYSARSLDAVGVGTVLGAMIEHRRASQPSFSSIVVPSEPATLRNLPDDDEDVDEDLAVAREPAAPRSPASEVFLKAR